MANKTTKRENFETIVTILEGLGKEDLVQVMNHEIELLNKKSASRTATKTQVENEGIKATILTVLEGSAQGMTITEIQKSTDELSALSNQKVSALVRQLIDSKEVVKTTDKKKSYFSLA